MPADEEYWFNGSFAAAAEPGVYAFKQYVENAASVPRRATAANVELRWTSAGASVDLDLVAMGPTWQRECSRSGVTVLDCASRMVLKQDQAGRFSDYSGGPGAPDSPASLHVLSPELFEANECVEPRCPWSFAAYIDGGGGAVEFQMHVMIRGS